MKTLKLFIWSGLLLISVGNIVLVIIRSHTRAVLAASDSVPWWPFVLAPLVLVVITAAVLGIVVWRLTK